MMDSRNYTEILEKVARLLKQQKEMYCDFNPQINTNRQDVLAESEKHSKVELSIEEQLAACTTLDQLKECISSEEITLSQDVLDAIETLHDRMPNPALKRTGGRDAG